MSARNQRHGSSASVVDLNAARLRPIGQRTVAKRSDGRRLGNHGNRASELIKQAIVRDLRDITLIRGEVTAADKHAAAARAGVSYRQVCRWWRTDLATQLDQAPATGAGQVDDDGALDPNTLPRFLYRYAEPAKFQFARDEIVFLAQHTSIKKGFAALAAQPNNRIINYSRSTLYAAWSNVSPTIRAGAKYGDKAQRAGEATYPLTGRDQANETWSIDEYDLKITTNYNGVLVEPKALIVRERHSGAPIAYTVVPRAANGIDTGLVLAAAAIGFTCPHPRDSGRELRVAGVPRMLVSDQGGPFIGDDGSAAARRLGIALNPTSSHRPQSNGDHEVMHQSLLRHFVDGAGSRRAWTNRAGTRLDHGVLPWETVLEEMDIWWTTILNSEYTSGDRKGRSRLEVYADAVDANDFYDGIELTPADEAAVAVAVAEASYDPTRGVMYDNRYWLSPELAAAAAPRERITLKQLLDPNVLYAFDRKGRFIGMLLDRADTDLEHVHDTHADRATRQQFVEHVVAETKAAAARADAAAAQNEVAERLADAADVAASDGEDDDPDDVIEKGGAPGTAAPTDAAAHDVDTPHVRRDVVRPTRRRRRAPAPDGFERRDNGDADAAAAAVAALYLRDDPHHEHEQHEQQQHDDHLDDEVEDEVDDREDHHEEDEEGGDGDAH